ncbi:MULTISPECIES: phosphoadenylyl-sulfate reductase [unclassified Coleofasciculus]|uniref:phosphoadenylyl-sulfate reductase n=1 Tax=unclassified Coleofasciculus TaxID=2692782 RepID=UPI0018828BED|nr:MULTISPECIES: phosphoadenylyl-sulfate reductase [unclassified Coleofasciculus]MBE9126301.1 phosphoadenylyl-sulfate reductase [Coleofasciculus sp. LEGE 07081]MBE9149220.1 phosphoadenylyl-sulfate reductase [Coleofasciculus sp. LEGE 07092]
MMEIEVAKLALEYADKSPQKILNFALDKFDNITISFSGAEDIVLIDMASKLKRDFNVFSIDTGRLHPETYRLMDEVRDHYGIKLEVIFPDASEVETLIKEKGLFSFYKDGHKECCGIRKVRPLRRKLATIDAWITGQRKDQSPNTRATIPVIQIDSAFSTQNHRLIKFNPLANWSSAQVWHYIRANGVPYNTLHEKGFTSIGCEPCTRPVLPNQHEREGRWWWEEAADKECGFHSINVANNHSLVAHR